jgi:sarcosine oxidase gamma subunit
VRAATKVFASLFSKSDRGQGRVALEINGAGCRGAALEKTNPIKEEI